MSWPVRWYGLSYAFGMLGAWFLCRKYVVPFIPKLTSHILDDSVMWGMAGIILGGRVGHILLYHPQPYFSHPLDILKVWEGGMAFHGGLIGIACAFWFYSKKNGHTLLSLWDAWSCVAPFGFLWGRIANFLNQELYGRITTLPWGIIFPHVDTYPRHPSQLYEAAGEGIILWGILLFALYRTHFSRIPGRLTGIFLLGYSIIRYLVEYTKEPLEMLTLYNVSLPLGQLYSIPFFLLGCFLLCLPSKDTP